MKMNQCRSILFSCAFVCTAAQMSAADTPVAMPVEESLVFSGAKPNVSIPGEPGESAFDLTEGLTVEAWIWAAEQTEPPKWQAIVTKGETAWGLTRYSDTNRICFRTHDGLEQHDLVGPVELVPETWVHIAATYDGETKSLYIDGQKVAALPWNGPIAVNDFALVIGANEEKSDRSFQGRMDNVRVWNVARTETEIQSTLLRRLYGNESGLLGCWRFNAVSGTALDSSINGADGTVTTSATPPAVAGIVLGSPLPRNHSLTFDGVDEFVVLPFESRFDFTDTLTAELWVYPESVADSTFNTPLVSKGETVWQVVLNKSAHVGIMAGGTTLESTAPLPLAQWSHVAAVVSAAGRDVYVNGVLDGHLDLADTPASTGDLPVRFGYNDWGQSPHFHGRMDGVRLWKTARTAQQIADNYDRRVNGKEPDLVGVWDFDTYNGGRVADGRKTFPAADTTVDFEGAAADSTPNEKVWATPVTEDGFEITPVAGSLVTSVTAAPEQVTVLRNSTPIAATMMKRADGLTFHAYTIEAAVAGGAAGSAVGLHMMGTREDGTTIEQVLDLDGEAGTVQTFELAGFEDLAALLWRRTGLPDDAETVPLISALHVRKNGPADSERAAAGTMAAMSELNRIAQEVALDDPLRPQYALELDGVGDYFIADDSSALELSDLTIEAWIRPTETGERQSIVRKGEDGYALTLSPELLLEYSVGELAGLATSSIPVTPDVWQHVAVRVDQFSGTTSLFINGLPAGTQSVSKVTNNDDHITVGRREWHTEAEHFKGGIDEIRIWNYPRTDAEIAFLSSRQPTTAMNGLVARWTLNDGVGTMVIDESGSLDGTLMGADGSEWIYGPDQLTGDGHFAMVFEGESADDYIRAPDEATFAPSITVGLTIEAWIKPEEHAPDDGLKEIIRKGDDGFGLALDNANYPRFYVSDDDDEAVKGYIAVTNREWHHVAVRVDTRADTTTFFHNGVSTGTIDGANIATNSAPFVIGRRFKGVIDEIRVWNVARPDDKIAEWAFRPLQEQFPGLLAYWRFDDGTGEAVTDSGPNGYDGVFSRPNAGEWQAGYHRLDEANSFWEAEELDEDENYSRDATTAGLWIGNVRLGAVSEVAATDPTVTTPTAQTVDFRIMLHVDGKGVVSLLKKVTAMQQAIEGEEPRVVLLTDDSYIPEFAGIVRRDGKMVGKRFTAIAYDFSGTELSLLGGLGAGLTCMGRIDLARRHVTNPYLHRYHPDHTRGYDIVREISVEFNPEGPAPGYGVEVLSGTYSEKVTGLHRRPIYTEGSVELRKVSDVEVLNE